jgi:hypothetical protein
MEHSPRCRVLLVIDSVYATPLSSIIFLCADDFRCPWSVTIHLMSDVMPVDHDVILIPLCDGCTGCRDGMPFFHLWLMRYHTHFFGARYPPVTCKRSRKN